MNRRGIYWAYGSNMALDQMRDRCPGAVPLIPAVLPAHRFRITSRGVATVMPIADGKAYGVLWRLTEDDEHRLDLYEGVAVGLYFRRYLDVVPVEGLGRVRVLAYIAADNEPGRPRDFYLDGIVRAARHWRFPARYVKDLRAWGEVQDQEAYRAFCKS